MCSIVEKIGFMAGFLRCDDKMKNRIVYAIIVAVSNVKSFSDPRLSNDLHGSRSDKNLAHFENVFLNK